MLNHNLRRGKNVIIGLQTRRIDQSISDGVYKIYGVSFLNIPPRKSVGAVFT